MTLIFEAKQKLGKFALDAAFTTAQGVTALFGPSGSGKTSIIRTIAGLATPEQGKIVLDDEVLVDTQNGIFVPKHRRRFGYVFQDAQLFPHLTVRQNLNYGRWFSPVSRHKDGLSGFVDLLGLGEILDRRPGKLSGGEKQRVAIGRALLSSPRLLLMDEPLAALDESRRAEILPYLETLRDEMNIPIIYVSHSVAEVARLADRVIVLNGGKVMMSGAAADVLNQPEISVTTDRREVGSLIEGTVLQYDSNHRLTTVGFGPSKIYLSGMEIAEGRRVRIHILAKDVMLSTVRPEHMSALNILEGTISSVHGGADGIVDVQIDCHGVALLARITALSRDRLGLEPGTKVFAIIKTVALDPY
jgi:molybdate transport system ATP-binding protein